MFLTGVYDDKKEYVVVDFTQKNTIKGSYD
jgi:hypothetical protein